MRMIPSYWYETSSISTIVLLYGTPAVRLTESTWISHIGVPPVLSKATRFTTAEISHFRLAYAEVSPGLSKVHASV